MDASTSGRDENLRRSSPPSRRRRACMRSRIQPQLHGRAPPHADAPVEHARKRARSSSASSRPSSSSPASAAACTASAVTRGASRPNDAWTSSPRCSTASSGTRSPAIAAAAPRGRTPRAHAEHHRAPQPVQRRAGRAARARARRSGSGRPSASAADQVHRRRPDERGHEQVRGPSGRAPAACRSAARRRRAGRRRGRRASSPRPGRGSRRPSSRARRRAAARAPTRIDVRSLASRLESGSSSRNARGSRTSARPIATRWRWPPESCARPALEQLLEREHAARSRRRAGRSPPGRPRAARSPKPRFSRTVMCGYSA